MNAGLVALIEDHHRSLSVARLLMLVLWCAASAVLVASCTVYRAPSGEFIGAVGGKGRVGPEADPIVAWDNDASFKDASRVAGTVVLAPSIEAGVATVGKLLTGNNANEAARISADQAVKLKTIEANAATAIAAP